MTGAPREVVARETRSGTAKREGRASVCYANPAYLIRRPISELLALQAGKRRLSLLIPARHGKVDGKLHHAGLFSGSRATLLGYRAAQLPGPFEWPIPGVGFLRQAWRALKEHDVVHCWAHFYPSTLLLMLMALFHRRTRVILTMDTLPGYSFRAGWAMDLAFTLWTWTFGRIVYGVPDVITLYGESLLPHAKRSGIDMRKVKVIPTGMMAHRVPSKAAARQRIAKALKIPKEGRIVLYAGLLNPRKRVEDVLAVAEKVPEAVFLVAGDGPLRRMLERRAKESVKNIRFLGWRKDLLTLMRAADALLFPSSAEGLPGVVMEAMHCELPVVTTRIPCTTDLITDEEDGLLTEVGDADAMAVALERVLNNEILAKRLAKSAKKKVTAAYSWKEILPRYEALYG